MRQVKTFGLLGTGVIGGGWPARDRGRDTPPDVAPASLLPPGVEELGVQPFVRLEPALEGEYRVETTEGEVTVTPVFELLRRRLSEYPPDVAAKITGGVHDGEVVVEELRRFFAGEPPLYQVAPDMMRLIVGIQGMVCLEAHH